MGCGTFYRAKKELDWKKRYEVAMQYYQKGKYRKASQLLETVFPYVRGNSRSPTILYTYADCQLQQGLYILSADAFKQFTKTYPRDDRAEEASYFHAYSMYLITEPYYLSAAPTFEAMEALQSYIETYPESKRRQKVQRLIDELQARLAEKSFKSAKLYHTIRAYKAATYALENFMLSHSDSKYYQEGYYLLLDAYYRWAEASIEKKQPERYQTFVTRYEDFLIRYPTSKYLPELTKLYSRSKARIQQP